MIGSSSGRWTPARKLELVLDVLRGVTTRDAACGAHGLDPSELDGWTRRVLEAGRTALDDDASQPGTMLDAIPALVWRADADGGLDFVNRSWLTYTGLTADEAYGSGWVRALHPDDAGRVLERWARALADGADADVEARLRRHDGAFRWFLFRAVSARDDAGKVVCWFGSNLDIEDRKRVEEALRRSEAEVARVARIVTMGELTASIAHEVNQPLAAIANNAGACVTLLAQSAPPLGEVRDAMTDIVDDAARASAVVTRLRKMASKAPLERTALDLCDVVGEIVALTRLEVDRRRVALRLELPERLPPVLGDRVQLQQVLLNLVVNAMDASMAVPDAQRLVTIRAEHGGSEAVVAVRDVGVGVRAEDVSRLFEPFYTTKADGIGMGLAISRSIVSAHGGRLWMERNDAAGATFLFSIPVAEGGTGGA